MMVIDPVPFPIESLDQKLWPLVDPEGASPRRMLLARGALPLPPETMVPALSFLLEDPDAAVREAATRTLMDMPAGTVDGVLSSVATLPPVLDRMVRRLAGKLTPEAHQRIALNRSVHDNTLLYLANRGEGTALEIISQNQARIAACPKLVQALYFNPKAKMSMVSRVLEFAVRENLPIQDMPGYREIVAGVLGEAAAAALPERKQAPQPAPEEPVATAQQQPVQQVSPAEPMEPLPSPPLMDPGLDDFAAELMEGLSMEILEDDIEGFGDMDTAGSFAEEVEDEEFDQLLLNVLNAAEDEEEESSKAIWDAIKKMGVPEKIRLALMGNGSARTILIRDSNKMVAMSVLRNPGLGDKEVVTMASNRQIVEDVIRTIASSREWSKNYLVKFNLCMNPKTPMHLALNFLRHLRTKDLKTLANSKDIPSVVAKAAKRLASTRGPGS